jgi:predicted Zn-dependent protease
MVLVVSGLVPVAAILQWRAGQLPAAERALQEGRFKEAREHLNRCLMWSPADPEVLCLAARLDRVEGNYNAAAAFLEQCDTGRGTATHFALESALLRAQRGDLSEEPRLLQLARSRSSQAPWILEALARAHLAAHHYSSALYYLDEWLKLQPDCVRGLEFRGRTLEHRATLSQAIPTYERVLRLDPSRWWVRARLVGIYLRGERLDQAAPHLDILERNHLEQPDACALLAQRDILQNRLAKARERLTAALRTDPKHGWAMLQLGKLELQLDRAAAAEELLTRAHQEYPYDTQIHHALAECYERLPGRKDRADFHRQRFEVISKHSRLIDEICSEKLPGKPNDAALLTELGVHFLRVGQDRLGEQSFLKALRSDPGYKPAHLSLAEFYQSTGKSEKAARHRTLASQLMRGESKASPRTPTP